MKNDISPPRGTECAAKRRIKFSKLGMSKYISHLDLLRCFTRAIMRAEIPVRYSQGFNPHMKLTFSLPLSIGVTSRCERLDIELSEEMDDSELMERLNLNLPPDIRILGVGDLVYKAATIVSAEYDVVLYGTDDKDAIKQFFALPEYMIEKKTKKKGVRQVNLMDFIKRCGIVEAEDGESRLNLILAAGGEANLKPELAVGALSEYLGGRIINYDIERVRIFCMPEKDGPLTEFV